MTNQYQITNVAQFDPFSGPKIEQVIHTTKAQSEILIDCFFGGDDAKRAYNLSFSLNFLGDFKFNALERAIEHLVERHESLRASFSEDGAFMSIFSEIAYEISYNDISNKSEDEKLKLKDALQHKDINYLFDLVNGPLFKASVIKLNENAHIFNITIHHSICDGLSVDIFLEELGIIYSAYVQDKLPSLPEVNPYSLFAEKENLFAETNEYKVSEGFWLNMYKESVPKVELPIDYPRPQLRTYNNHRLDFLIDDNLLNALKQTGINAGCSLVTTLMAAFEVFLYQQTGQNDLVVGLTNSRPAHFDMTQIIGHGVNVLPLRSKVDSKITFNHYLTRRKSQFFDAYEHQSISFGHVLEKLSVTRDASRIPLVPVMLNLELNKNLESEISFHNLSHDLTLNIGDYGTFEIELQAFQSKDGPCFRWKYNTTLFKPETIQKMMISFEEIIKIIVANPNVKIGDFIKVDDSPYLELNDTSVSYPQLPLHQLIIENAKNYGQKCAIIFSKEEMSYSHLSQQVNRLSQKLTEIGVEQGDIIGVALPRSTELVVTLLAIMQCGAAYLPLDTNYPQKRLEYMLSDSGAKFLITSKDFSKSLETSSLVLLIEDLFLNLIEYSGIPISITIKNNQTAYILYTSGSTGKPKGVPITHKSFVNFLCSMSKKPGVEQTDKLLSITTISFDIAGLELFLPLLSGATLVLANDNIAKDGRLLLDYIKDKSITMLQATPTTWQMLLDSGWVDSLPIKALCGGEMLPVALSKKILTKVNELWNMYGPTETTIWSTTKQILIEDNELTIGKPIDNTQIYILNEQGLLMPAGTVGEIVIGGDGVSSGYWKREALSSEKFIDNPFDSHSKLYRTGDLGKLLLSGEIQCLGRMDDQVKIRGHRIELGEIEEVLNIMEGVKSSLVMIHDDRLIAFVIEKQLSNIQQDEVQKWKIELAKHLPNYMIPHSINIINEFPKTLNGKIDRQSLLKSLLNFSNSVSNEYTEPRTKTEFLVADVWKKCLHIEKISVFSDFFELGGHSLIAVRVMSLIEQETGHRYPLSTLMLYPTIETLAKFINYDIKSVEWDSLVPIKPEGNKTPLYIIHGGEFNVLIFKSLVNNLDVDQPVYGLQAKGLNGIDIPHESIQEMAAHYISEITASNPVGPYALAGYSFGGIIAFEMARQLKALDKEIKTPILLDSYVYPNYYYSNPYLKRIANIKYKLGQVVFVIKNMVSNQANFKHRISLVKEKINHLFLRIKHGKEKTHSMLYNWPLQLEEKHIEAFHKFHIKPLDIEVDLLKVADDDIFYAHDTKYLGWDKIALGGINRHKITGNHKNLFSSPNVEVLAKTIQDLLDNSD